MNKALKWKLAFAFLLVFCAGATTGFFGTFHLRHHIIGPPHSGDVNERMREHLRRALDLTPEQSAKIAPVVDATTAKLEAIRIETAQRVRAAMEDSKKEIAPLLTPEQQKKLEKLEAEHRRMMHHHGFDPILRHEHESPPPPP